MKSFSKDQRTRNLEDLKNNFFDLIIIGGGINGAGVARDAALRGMKVALIEQNDFASGTSSRSSKLIHGGIRYLENLEFGLVFEALSERAHLFDMAPHLVHPLRFVLPVYQGDRVGKFKLGMGMALYDVLSSFEAPELHENLNAEETMDRLPLLNSKQLKGSFVYSDAYMDDDRLVVESLRSANHLGANIVNYVSAEKVEFPQGNVLVSCKNNIEGESFQISGKHLLCGLGPWTDQFGESHFSHWKKCLRPTKGVHITVARDRVQMEEAVVMVSEDQKRIIFGIPRHEMTIFGTTDTDYKGDPSKVQTEKADVEYLLKHINLYFPGAKLTKEDIIASYVGVRPLVDDGSSTEGKTSREHEIWNLRENCTIVAGGKYTTYRLIAEQVMEKILNSFSVEDLAKFDRCDSKSALNPLANFDAMSKARAMVGAWHTQYGFDKQLLDTLVDRHGMEAFDILKRKKPKEEPTEECLWVLEARHAILHTMCVNLRDFYFRRSPLFLSRHNHGMEFLDAVSSEFAERFSWTKEEEVKQRRQLMDQMKWELSWRD